MVTGVAEWSKSKRRSVKSKSLINKLIGEGGGYSVNPDDIGPNEPEFPDPEALDHDFHFGVAEKITELIDADYKSMPASLRWALAVEIAKLLEESYGDADSGDFEKIDLEYTDPRELGDKEIMRRDAEHDRSKDFPDEQTAQE